MLSPTMREELEREVPWMTVEEVAVLKSKDGATYKAVVQAVQGDVSLDEAVPTDRFETVLMRNARGHWSVCVSSQVGCAMACTFCATGKMGLKRSLTTDEIVDQYRFWVAFLAKRPELSRMPVSVPDRASVKGGVSSNEARITNIVYMGMGEPLANYDAVKESVRQLLAYTDLGPTRIVVSTVGLVPVLHQLLDDPEWPPVRLAVSLHSADPETRKRIMPTSYDAFLDKLAEWAKVYFERFESRRRHVTFEYVLLEGINDTDKAADQLARFANLVGKVRINLIPYNATASSYRRSQTEKIEQFQSRLEEKGVTVTRRRAMGDDIAAACGQLVTEGKE